jgi:DNA-binding transcriptional MerR regulator/methylmalonyl-CoA mutase cobalamin-binding subunit
LIDGADMKSAAQRHTAPAHDAFPLRTVAAMTGLTPDLIRAWEKRYAVVAPIRGARGARLYTSADITHLRLLARVVGAGRAIGDVAALSRAELEKLAAQRAPDEQGAESGGTHPPREDFVTRILERLERFDYAAVSRLLGDAVVGLGIRTFVHEVVLPLVQRVGARWADGELSIAEEHLLTGTLRNLLAGLMQSRTVTGRPVLLATPVGERHEIGLLLAALVARDAGANVVYLGTDLPAAEIVTAATRTRARVVGLSVVAGENRARAIDEVAAIQIALPAEIELWLGGADAQDVAAGAKALRGLVLDTLQATETELTRIAAGAQPHSWVDGAKP